MQSTTKDEKLRTNVANFLNDELVDDLKTLSKARSAVDKLESMKRALENQVSVVGDESPQKLGRVLRSADKALEDVQRLATVRQSLARDALGHTSKHEHLLTEFTPAANEVVELEKYLKYMQWIQTVDDISSKLKSSLDSSSNAIVTQHFTKLANLCKYIQGSSCKHLVKYVTDTTLVWHRILKDKFSKEFDDILKGIKWPCIPSIPGYVHAPSFEALSSFEHMFRILLDIHLPNAEFFKSDDVATDQVSNLIVLPLQLLLRPFKKRFIYHFTGNKKTNTISRPEWYFTQILTWIRDHVVFVEQYVQPVLNRAGQSRVMAKVEFIRGLVELVIAKISKDITTVLFDEAALAHIINETLFFERELKKHGYPSGQPSCLHVVTQEACFNKWLQMERKLAMDNVDTMLSSDSAWKSQYQEQTDVDENKVPECAERFLTMIQSITDRYKILPMPGHRLQFLEIQLDIIDDFRLRLCQLRNEAADPLMPNFCSILNVVYYLSHVLNDWCDLPFFLQMQYYKLQRLSLHTSLKNRRTTSSSISLLLHPESGNDELLNSSISTTISSIHRDVLDSISEDFDEDALDSMEGTVFEEVVELLQGMKDEMIRAIITCVVMDVKAKSLSYRHEKWFVTVSAKDVVTPTVSPSAIGMFMVLSHSLLKLVQILAVPLFNVAWQNIAEHLNEFLYEELILMNKFSEAGATQLNYDMNRNLFPLFAEYTRKPENFFKEVKESCILLTIKQGSALLLKETMCNAIQPTTTSFVDPSRALEEMGVFKLTPRAALDILNRRTDLCV